MTPTGFVTMRLHQNQVQILLEMLTALQRFSMDNVVPIVKALEGAKRADDARAE